MSAVVNNCSINYVLASLKFYVAFAAASVVPTLSTIMILSKLFYLKDSIIMMLSNFFLLF